MPDPIPLPTGRPAGSWRPWITLPPAGSDLVRIWRAGWRTPLVIAPGDLDPQTNATGLLWEPWRGATIEGGPNV